MMTANRHKEKPTVADGKRLNAKSASPTKSTTILKMQSTMKVKLLWLMILLITAGCHRTSTEQYRRHQKREYRKAGRQAKVTYYKARIYKMTH